jgi:hypothetical protein
MLVCWCCDRRLSRQPCDCGAGYCERCGVCEEHCQCPEPWIVYDEEERPDGPDEPHGIQGQPQA